jgi:hypothetical protein
MRKILLGFILAHLIMAIGNIVGMYVVYTEKPGCGDHTVLYCLREQRPWLEPFYWMGLNLLDCVTLSAAQWLVEELNEKDND